MVSIAANVFAITIFPDFEKNEKVCENNVFLKLLNNEVLTPLNNKIILSTEIIIVQTS